MRTAIGRAAALLVLAGLVTNVAANENAAGVVDKRGLSPITITPEMKTITFCRDKESWSPDINAANAFSPISAEFLKQIGKTYSGTIEEAKQYKATLLVVPKHGEVRSIDDYNDWVYLPTVDYEGADRVVFLVENQGKQYKVVINFLVAHIFDENRKVQECESMNFGT